MNVTATLQVAVRIVVSRILIFAIAAIPAAAIAQTATFVGAQSTVASSSTFAPASVAVDNAGGVYYSDDATNSIVKLPAGGGSPVTIASGLSAPTGVAVDRKGNVFFAQGGGGSGTVVELPWTGSGYGSQVTVFSGLNSPQGVGVDSKSNVFITDSTLVYVIEVPAGTYGSGMPTVVGSGLSNPGGIAVDSTGNLFVADTGNGRIVMVPFFGSAYIDPFAVVVGLSSAWGVAVDAADNLYYSEAGTQKLFKLKSNGPAAWTTTTALIVGLNTPFGVAVDAWGNVFAADAGNHRLLEYQQNSVSFGGINVCPAALSASPSCSQTASLKVHVSTYPASIGADAVTGGVDNLDFNFDPTTSSCAQNSDGGEDCAITVQFQPMLAGIRHGALEVFDNTQGKLLASVPLYGFGMGPQIAYNPPTPINLFYEGLAAPGGIAVDDAENIYVVDALHAQIFKIPSDGSSITTVGSGFYNPWSVAVDGAGNVYVADGGNHRVVKIPADGSAQSNVNTIALGQPFGVAVDARGDVFVTDLTSKSVIEFPANGSAAINIGSGLTGPESVAVDAAGNIFVANTNQGTVVKISAIDGVQSTINYSFEVPVYVSTTSWGDLYVSDVGAGAIFKIAGGLVSVVSFGATANTQSVAADSAGNLFAADYTSLGVIELPRTQPPSLTFAATKPGLTSTDSPQTVVVENVGNQPLVFSSSGAGTNPAYPADFPEYASDTNLCTKGLSLAPGGVCDVAVKFSPVVGGKIHENIVLTDNAGNQSGAVQQISVSGVGTQSVPVINWITPAPILAGTALNSTQLNATSTTLGTFTYSPVSGTVLSAGLHKLTVTLTPFDTVNYTSAKASVMLYVEPIIKVAPKVTWAPPAAINYGAALGAAQLNAKASVAGKFAYSPAAGTVLHAGAQTLTVTFTPTDTKNYSTAAASVSLTVTPAPLTITATSVSVTYGQPIPKLTFTASGFVNKDTVAVLKGAPVEATGAKQGTAIGNYPITITKGTLADPDYTFTFKPGTLTIKPIGVAATPVFKPAPASYKTSVSVTITDTTPGAVIHYTTNGAAPTASSTKYTAAIVLKATATIKSIAIAPGYTNSAVASAKYTITQ